MYNPSSIHQGLVVQFRVDNRCFLGKMHHFKRSRHMLRMEFSRRHFLKVRSTWLRLPVCSCACTISTLLFFCKMILIAMTELLQIPQLEDSRLTSEATDGWLRVHEGPHWHICDVGWLAMPTPLDSDLICPSRFPLCSPFSKKLPVSSFSDSTCYLL